MNTAQLTAPLLLELPAQRLTAVSPHKLLKSAGAKFANLSPPRLAKGVQCSACADLIALIDSLHRAAVSGQDFPDRWHITVSDPLVWSLCLRIASRFSTQQKVTVAARVYPRYQKLSEIQVTDFRVGFDQSRIKPDWKLQIRFTQA